MNNRGLSTMWNHEAKIKHDENETIRARASNGLGWLPIESAPQNKNIIGKFWHGDRQFIVEAAPRGDGGWQDVVRGSCVGWMPGGKPAYWMSNGDTATLTARIAELEKGLGEAVKALGGAIYAIKGREHTGFLEAAINDARQLLAGRGK